MENIEYINEVINRLRSKIKNIANAIRNKTGKSSNLTIEQMCDEIQNLGVEELIQHADIEEFVKQEAFRVANLVQQVKTDDSIVFLAMSDSHHCGDKDGGSWQKNTNTGNLHAVQAAKILSYILDMDFVCHLGDITFGNGTSTTSEILHDQLEEVTAWLDESQKNIPTFMTVGNHDTGMYAVSAGTEESLESAEYLFSIFGARCKGAIYGSTEFGYCYRDFDDKKLRVICLNSSERDTLIGYGANPSMSEDQLLWFAQTLQDIGSKTDASSWRFLVLSHYPLDYSTSYLSSHVIKAYIDGTSISFNNTTINFNGCNNAKFIANFHGHTHCYKYARLNEINANTKTATEFDALRVAIPNSGFYRNNHQAESDKHGISFKDSITYDKEIGGAKDTAFVVNVINPSKEVIYSYCYGAGIDRTISYGDIEFYNISTNLSRCSITNSSVSIEHGNEFNAELILEEHCSITSVEITMGGIDITSSVYSDGVINIPEVTGGLVINAYAEIALACTNQIPISTDANGNIYNNIGYKAKTYINNGVEKTNTETCLTGFIPCKVGDVIRLKNMPFNSTVNSCRLSFFDSDKTFISEAIVTSTYHMDTYHKGVKDSDGNYICWTIKDVTGYTTDCAFVRITAISITDESIVTINEEIKYADEVENVNKVTYNLTNSFSTNNSSVVVEGNGYSATITANAGYVLDNVIITMGGIDITSSVYSDGVINIQEVTGDLVINVTAIIDDSVNYTNQIPISTDADGNIYNGTGFKENTYISSGNDASKTGYYSSGFIPCTVGDTLYFKNIGLQDGQDYHRIAFYDSNKTYKGTYKTSTSTMNGLTYGEDGNIEKWVISSGSTIDGTSFIRFCCSYIGADSIVTVNEPI